MYCTFLVYKYVDILVWFKILNVSLDYKMYALYLGVAHVGFPNHNLIFTSFVFNISTTTQIMKYFHIWGMVKVFLYQFFVHVMVFTLLWSFHISISYLLIFIHKHVEWAKSLISWDSNYLGLHFYFIYHSWTHHELKFHYWIPRNCNILYLCVILDHYVAACLVFTVHSCW